MEEVQRLQEQKPGSAKGANKVSITDPQARFMKQSDGGLAPSYNVQISTDSAHCMIVAVDVTSEASDSSQLLPALERIEERLERKPQQIVADGGYTTGEAIEQMAEREVDFLGNLGRNLAGSGITAPHQLPPSAFLYDPRANRLRCPEGKLLLPQGRRKKGPGSIYHHYEAKAEDCLSCLRKPACCPNNQRRGRSVMRLEESAMVMAFRQKMATAEAQQQYRRRGRIAEFCHAWIKCKLGLRWFHVRGRIKARTEALWACLTYNLQQWIRLSMPHTPAGSTEKESRKKATEYRVRPTLENSPLVPGLETHRGFFTASVSRVRGFSESVSFH